jgi:Xaa-Pro dipeptidase
MRAEGIAVVGAASPETVYYLTGLDHLGYFAFTLLVVPESGQPVLVTRAMEAPTVRAQVPWCRHVVFGDGESPAAAALAALADAVVPGVTVALDEESMFFPPAIAAAIRDGLPGVRWLSAYAILAMQRAVKSPAEIGHIRQAASISDQAVAAGIAAARPGVSERSVAAEVYRAMIEAGGEPPGFPPLIRPTTMLEMEAPLRLPGRHRLPAKLGRRRRGARHPRRRRSADRPRHDLPPDVLGDPADRARRLRHGAGHRGRRRTAHHHAPRTDHHHLTWPGSR